MIRRQTIFLTNTWQLLISFHERISGVPSWCYQFGFEYPKIWSHSEGNHSPHGFTLSYLKSTFSDLSSKQGSVNLSGRLCPGDTPTPRISILVRWHLYIEPCPNNQTFGIKFKVFVCQQCYIKHYNTPSEGCWHVTPLSMQRRNAIM